jgi:hypothetical protein
MPASAKAAGPHPYRINRLTTWLLHGWSTPPCGSGVAWAMMSIARSAPAFRVKNPLTDVKVGSKQPITSQRGRRRASALLRCQRVFSFRQARRVAPDKRRTSFRAAFSGTRAANGMPGRSRSPSGLILGTTGTRRPARSVRAKKMRFSLKPRPAAADS